MFPPFRLHGAIQPYSETLLYSGFADLNLARLFMAAIFLGASGAVIDLAIDVSAAMSEVARKRPDLSFLELTKSGLYVGRPMAATMVTTLLMAYVSEYMALLMVLLSKGIPLLQVVNLNYISAVIPKNRCWQFRTDYGGALYCLGRRLDECEAKERSSETYKKFMRRRRSSDR